MNMVKTTDNLSEDMIDNLQKLKSKTKLKIYKNINYYDNMNIKFQQDPFARNAQDISKIYHEVLLLMKFLQSKPQVQNMNIKYYDLYYTVIEKRKEIAKGDEYEKDYINFIDIVPNQYDGN